MASDKHDTNNSHNSYPPVVSVLGHVDHGKTSLLDRIRETGTAEREAGGITQKIGASHIEITHDSKKRTITFIDTPGHEAFANMRSQGVNAADVVLLVVASDDGVMPQTKESIEKIKEAQIPYIVVFTKVDLESSNVEKVKQQLLSEGVLLEGLGGEVPFISVSSKTGERVKELLDLVLLVYDLSGHKKDESANFLGVVIDAKLDKRRGVVCTAVVKQGILAVGDKVYMQGKEIGKARALFDSLGANVKKVGPGEACEILGISEAVATGTPIYNAFVDIHPQKSTAAPPAPRPASGLSALFANHQKDTASIILKTETSGEMEAIKESLPDEVRIAFEGQGDIAVADILMAKDLQALVVGFNVKITKDAQHLAETEGVFYRSYSIIYELLDEIQEVVEMLQEQGQDKVLGAGNILAKFQGTSEVILGVRVDEGRFRVGDKVKITRKDEVIGESAVVSIRKVKEDVKEVGKGNECGITISPSIDFAPGDDIISYK